MGDIIKTAIRVTGTVTLYAMICHYVCRILGVKQQPLVVVNKFYGEKEEESNEQKEN